MVATIKMTNIYVHMIENNYLKFELKIQSIIYVYLVINYHNLDIKNSGSIQSYLCMDGLYHIMYSGNGKKVPLETVFALDDLHMYFLTRCMSRYG